MSALSSPAMCWWKWIWNDDVWHVVKSTPRVTGFLGTGQHPRRCLKRSQPDRLSRCHWQGQAKLRVKFDKNESVRITDGRSPPLLVWWMTSTKIRKKSP